MNFNLGDPLADIFSDGSDESFFETNTADKKTKNKENLKEVNDIFGIKKDIAPASSANSKIDIMFNDDDDDLISDLGFNPKKPKTGSKSSVLDDLLGSISRSDKPDPVAPKIISRQSTETTDTSISTSQGRTKSSTARMSSVASMSNPLGLFSNKNANEPSSGETTIKKKFGSTADWLGLGDTNEEKNEALPTIRSSTTSVETSAQKHDHSTPPVVVQHDTTSNSRPTTAIENTPFVIASNNLEAENNYQLLKQQEAQVSMAGQLRSHEQLLLNMQKRQQDMLAQQDSQFNDLLQKQLKRQSQLEMNIRSQQERINAQIQMLMLQPSSTLTTTEETTHNSDAGTKNDGNNLESVIQLEADVKKLELEKLRLEDLVSNINSRHETEIVMVENAFKKQITVLEENSASIESRLKEEIKSLQEFYATKLKLLEDEKQSLIIQYSEDIKNYKEAHISEIKQIKSSYEDDIQSINEEHKRMIESIRQSKLLEFSALQDNASYIQTLREASSYLQNAGGELKSIKEDMDNKIDFIYKERESKIENRERKVEDAEKRLKLSEVISEEERKRLMDLVSALEGQLNSLSKESSEQNWIMRQKMASIAAEKDAFEKEKEFSREQMSRDEKRIEELKQFQLEETQRSMQRIAEERKALSIERSQLETMKKLGSPLANRRSNVELDIALNVAKDATNQADQEREKYFKMQRELEHLKRNLIEKEHAIQSKEEEIESERVNLRIIERKCQQNIQKSKLAQQSFNEKGNFLQNRLKQVSEREMLLSQERLALSNERLKLREMEKQIKQNKCSLCKISQNNPEISTIFSKNTVVVNSVLDCDVSHSPQNICVQQTSVDHLMDEDFIESLKGSKDMHFSSIMGEIDLEYQFENLTALKPIGEISGYQLQ